MNCNRCPYLRNSSHNECPFSKNENDAHDVIHMNTDTDIEDKDGNKLSVKVPPPEYTPEIFGK